MSRGRSFYLEPSPDPVFAVLHRPEGSPRSDSGVVLCPPFGADELSTYRSLRAWADALAAAGHTALRIDLPGSGDSATSPQDPGRVAAWTTSVAAAVDWLRGSVGCQRVAAVGVGLGGMVALRALAEGAPIDDLILWSVPARGRLLLRELRVFSKVAAGGASEETTAPEPPVSAEGGLEVFGFAMSPETVAELEALDLTSLPVPGAADRRVLLLGRDTLPPDRRLAEHLERAGVALSVADGPGYGRMVTHPQFAEPPLDVFARTIEWLDARPPAAVAAGSPAVARRPASQTTVAEIRVGPTTVRETPVDFEIGGERLTGVLAQPPDSATPAICGVFLNAGAVRRIGPNRMWVEAARRWAARGVPSLRLDVRGLGDSDGDERRYRRTSEFYSEDLIGDVLATFDALQERGLPGRFFVGGLCSGAYWALHAALADQRVRGLFLVNLWSFFYSEELAARRDAGRARAMLRTGAWRDVARMAIAGGRLDRLVRAKLRAAAHPGLGHRHSLARLDEAVDRVLDALGERQVQTLLLLSQGEPLADEFATGQRIARLAAWPHLTFERLPIDDHVFTPVWAQRLVHEALDRELDRTLAQVGRERVRCVDDAVPGGRR